MTLELDGLSKRYGGKTVLDGVSHRFAAGLTLLVGPSGAGKSTLLRLMATAEKPSKGRILLGRHRPARRPPGAAPDAGLCARRRSTCPRI